MGIRIAAAVLAVALGAGAAPAASRLQLDDKARLWPKAGRGEKIDFTNRMGKAMSKLSPDLTNEYFLRCLEETANIGDTKDLTLGDLVKTCISMKVAQASDQASD